MEINSIGIIGAMEEEIAEIKELMQVKETYTQATLTFFIGEMNNKKIILVRCGIGKVNAAMCTQILIDKFNPDCIINIGVAGAVFEELNVGDIVISQDALHHDFDTVIFGDGKGVIPRMEESIFKADPWLMDLAKKAGQELKSHHIFIGRVLSGDQFIADTVTKKRLYDEFKGYCTEMEGSAIAHVSYLNKIPFVIIRSISDKADDSADISFDEFTGLAAANASFMIKNMVSQLN